MFIVVFVYISATAQTFQITSFEGKKENINVSQKQFSKTLTVAYLADTLRFSECTGIDTAEILNKNFLKIIYGVRGGTGFGLKNTAVISVSKDKLVVSLLFLSNIEVLLEDNEIVKFNNLLNLRGTENPEIFISSKGDLNFSTNFIERNINETSTLKFDQNLKLFCNGYKNIQVKLPRAGMGVSTQKNTNTVVRMPYVTLENSNYYFLNEHWYKNQHNNELVSEYR